MDFSHAHHSPFSPGMFASSLLPHDPNACQVVDVIHLDDGACLHVYRLGRLAVSSFLLLFDLNIGLVVCLAACFYHCVTWVCLLYEL